MAASTPKHKVRKTLDSQAACAGVTSRRHLHLSADGEGLVEKSLEGARLLACEDVSLGAYKRTDVRFAQAKGYEQSGRQFSRAGRNEKESRKIVQTQMQAVACTSGEKCTDSLMRPSRFSVPCFGRQDLVWPSQ